MSSSHAEGHSRGHTDAVRFRKALISLAPYIKSSVAFAVVPALALLAGAASAQDLGPHFRKIKDGIYVQSAREVNSTASIVLTEEGMKALNQEIVVPGHGSPGTTTIFDDNERYFRLLLDRVGALAKAGNTLDQIKQELKMPEYAGWAYPERMPGNVEAAYRAVTR